MLIIRPGNNQEYGLTNYIWSLQQWYVFTQYSNGGYVFLTVHMGRPMKLPLLIHCFATHWHYMGLHWLFHVTVHVKPLFCHTLALHGPTLVVPCNCPCKAIVLPRIGITWSLHWSVHETAYVKPLFCYSLALHGIYIGRFMKLPI